MLFSEKLLKIRIFLNNNLKINNYEPLEAITLYKIGTILYIVILHIGTFALKY
jgi:hypothetical protein